MNVVMVLNRFFPMIGGAEAQCKSLSEGLIKNHDCNINILTYKHDEKLQKREVISGMTINRLSSPFWGQGLFYMSVALYLLVKRNKIDIIHCHSISVTSFICAFLACVTRNKCVLKHTISGEIDVIKDGKGIKAKLKFLLIRYALNNSLVVTLTEEGREELERNKVLNYQVISNGVDKDCFTQHVPGHYKNEDTIGFLGRFCDQKGIDILISAYLASDRHNGLILMGSTQYQLTSNIDVMLEAAKKEVGNNLIVMEPQNPPYSFYTNITIYVSASRFEGMPNTVLEALALNKTCILSNIRPHKELKEKNPNAKIYLFDTIADLTRLINSVRSESQIFNEYLSDRYLMQNVARDYYNVYEKLSRI
ncbi:glycosyltransferase family 4 protein [Pectobacterium carotovorum]|uniref:glycosyltransferase family 4 protein n=1 Tax=Pectobacterium carotovorum TaxID=554 RepID=UPI002A81A635|nr:glycosyltransferase family 4 protein [Pectobacterium carotovorum]MDY4376083.1 glycosyltransferase family 4 protein [Pectobacterium carotovorum subsp. carotovorum]